MLTNLENILQPLINAFNRDVSKPRFVTLLSPTWPKWVIDGARAVLEGVLKPFPEADLSILVVWIALKDTDTLQSAHEAAEKFTDRRVKQFFDSARLTGKAVAASLGHDDEIAWDFYLFYPAGAKWLELPPEPEAYMHQLPKRWTDPNRFFEKKMLKKELASTMQSLFT